jgi:hypothetical protein
MSKPGSSGLQAGEHVTMAIEDFPPSESVSRLRARGEITSEARTTTVRFDDVEFVVALTLRRFPNGGSWSFFVCPCGRRARILRLHEGGLACRWCLGARGYRPRVQLCAHAGVRASRTAPRRLELLTSAEPARLDPRPGCVLDRRAHMEFALRRSLIVARRHGVDRAKDEGL